MEVLRNISVALHADYRGYVTGMTAAGRATADMGREVKGLAGQSVQLKQDMEKAGKAMMVGGGSILVALGASAAAAIKFESAFAGVIKTVDAGPKAISQIRDEMRELSRVAPATAVEIAAVGEAAGQLGIAAENVTSFSKVMIDLGETTDLTADQAATSLAQLANITQMSQGDFDRLGATIVALGNAGASTESQISEMGLRIAGAGATIGLSEAEILGFASALSSLGINAEAGGSAISRVFVDIAAAVDGGGEKLDTFAQVAGMTAERFAADFELDPARAISAFIAGLGRVQQSGQSLFGVLEDLSFSEIRVRDTLLRTANAGELLNDQLELGRRAWGENTALAEEAAKRYETTAAQLEILRNNVVDVAISLGDQLLPAIQAVAGWTTDLVDGFGSLPEGLQSVVAFGGLAAGALVTVGGAALVALPRIMATKKALDALTLTAPGIAGLAGTMGRLTLAAGKLGLIFAGVMAIDAWGASIRDVDADTAQLVRSMDALAQSGKATGEAARVFGKDLEDLGDTINDAAKSTFLGFDNPFDSTTSREIKEARDQISDLDEALATLATTNAPAAADAFDEIKDALREQGFSYEAIAAVLPKYQQASEAATAAAREQAETVGGPMVDETGRAVEATVELSEAQEDLRSVLAQMADPMTAYELVLGENEEKIRTWAEAHAANTADAKDSWQDYADGAQVSLAEFATALEDQLAAYDNWANNLAAVAARGRGDVAKELAKLGPEAAPLVAQFATATQEEFDRAADLMTESVRRGGDGSAVEMDRNLDVLAAIAADGANATAKAIADRLNLSVLEVAAIAERYGRELRLGIDPVLEAIQRTGLLPGNADPNARRQGSRGYTENAEGNLYEAHNPQIAPGGAMRLWAEPETGGEAYIPLAPDRRARSVEIWQETGRRLGVFAAGGFTGPGDVPWPPNVGTGLIGGTAGLAMDAEREAVIRLLEDAPKPLGAGVGYQAMFAALQAVFPWVTLISGLRPGAITATGKPSYHGMGRAVDINPSMALFEWIAANYPSSRELIFSPAGGRQIHNGSPHYYGEPTRGDHWDHVHWAMARGGILNPHIRDNGGPLLPGFTFNGTGRPEQVVPMADGGVLDVTAFIHEGKALRATLAGLLQDTEVGRVVRDTAIISATSQDQIMEQIARDMDRVVEAYIALASVAGEDVARDLAAQHLFAEDYEAASRQMVDAIEARKRAEAQAAEDAARQQAEAAEAARRHNELLADLQRQQVDNSFELGLVATSDYLAELDRRMAAETAYTDAWMALFRQRERIVQEETEKRARLEDSYRQPIEDFGNLSTLFSGREGDLAGEEILAALDHRLEVAQRYAGQVQELRSQGWGDLAEQLAQAGPEQMGLVNALAGADRDAVLSRLAQFTALGKSLVPSAGGMGGSVSVAPGAVSVTLAISVPETVGNAQQLAETLRPMVEDVVGDAFDELVGNVRIAGVPA